jgi:hypothetical protein
MKSYTEADVFYDEILVDFLMTKKLTEQSQLVSSPKYPKGKQTYTLAKRPCVALNGLSLVSILMGQKALALSH